MEIAHGRTDFLFRPVGPEMTLREVVDALIGRSISERDANTLIKEPTLTLISLSPSR